MRQEKTANNGWPDKLFNKTTVNKANLTHYV